MMIAHDDDQTARERVARNVDRIGAWPTGASLHVGRAHALDDQVTAARLEQAGKLFKADDHHHYRAHLSSRISVGVGVGIGDCWFRQKILSATASAASS